CDQDTPRTTAGAALMTPLRPRDIRPHMDNASNNSCPTCGSWWRLPVLLAFVLAAILLSRFWPSQAPPKAGNASEAVTDPAREHVSLSIDFGDGRTKDILDVAWSPGTTVAD